MSKSSYLCGNVLCQNESKESKSQSILVDYDLYCREQSSEYRAGGDQSKGGYGGIHKETENGGVES